MNWHDVCPAAQLEEDFPLGVTVAEKPLGLYRVQGKFFAISDICTHQYARLSEGYPDGHLIECPLHAAKFDLRSGKCVSGPGNGDLQTYEVEVRGERLFVKV